MADMAENNSLYFMCNICQEAFISFDEVSIHLKTMHSNISSININGSVSILQVNTEPTNTAQDDETVQEVTVAQPADTDKLWASETILLLINLVEKYDKDFQTKIKKHVWQKISQEINKTLKTESFDWNKCNTKWKGLIRTYKDIKNHNATSGKNRRHWEYYNKINNFYCKQPEITPVATCSNLEGLVENNTDEPQPSVPSSQSSSSSSFESSFSRKRKLLGNPAERRHQEKMVNQQRYLDIMEKMLEEMKKQNASKEDTKKNN